MRWRCTSHHGRAWRRKRRCCSASRPCHKAGCAAAGCRPPRASRPRRRAAAASATARASSPSGNSSSLDRRGLEIGVARAGSGRAATRPTILPRCPAASSDSTRSTMVRPVPTSSASSPVCSESLDRGAGFGAPRIADEALAGAPRKRSALPAPGCRPQAPARRPRSSRRRRARSASRRSPRSRERAPRSNNLRIAAGHRLVEDFARDSGRTAAAGRSRAGRRLRSRSAVAKWSGSPAQALIPSARTLSRCAGFGRRISDAAAHPAAAVDQDRGDAAPRQLGGEDGARKPAADDRDRHEPVRFHSQASSPDPPRPLCAIWIWS